MPIALPKRRSRPRDLAMLAQCVVVCLLLVLASGCIPVRQGPAGPGEGPPLPSLPSGPRYEPTVGQDAATVAQLRAAPPPKRPELVDGGTPRGDEPLLNARGYVRIGTGTVPAGSADVREWSEHQGRQVGADKAYVYAGAESTRVDFYVRYRLPFGATFRTMNKDEEESAGSGGVQLGEIVGGTPASEANLRRGDLIVAFDGKPIDGRPGFERLLREHLGKRVTLTVRRGDAKFERLVRLGVVAKPAADAQD
jgi:membrane-associated protease RseP (regulator of RpoE activity)